MASSAPLDVLREILDSVTPGAEGIAAVEELGRLVDAARVRVVASMDDSYAASLGFASPTAAVATLARVSEKTARSRLTLAEVTRIDRTLTGAEVPARLPLLAASLEIVGADAAEVIARALEAVRSHLDPSLLAATESVMVNLASGLDATGTKVVAPESVTSLVSQFSQIAAAVDPDGARPREERARRRRSFRVGAQDADGLLPVSGRLLPEVGTLLLGLLEAHRRTPRFTDEPEFAHFDPVDSRSPDQRRHDAVAEVVIAAARARDARSLDGMPVTVVVTTTLENLADESGRDGDPIGVMTGSRVPVSRGVVEQFIDANGLRLVRLSANGSVAGVSSLQRCFTPTQRLAIAARDGQRCLVPGCTAPHYALQAHHVTPWREAGPTRVDNGILLCYWHHQRVDDGPWRFRMNGGVPEVRGPGIPNWMRSTAPERAVA